MSSGKNLGIFWGNNAFSVSESHQDVPQKCFRILHNPAPVIDQVSPASNTDDIQFVTPIKEAIRSNKISLVDVNLALPSKDIVIRSFVIPLVKQSEVRGVVEFEVKKYIPFNLKDLSYNFHAVNFVEDKVKRMRVHFVAIRKEILERYKGVLKQSGLNVIYSEPAPMSLARILIHKKLIKSDQKVAILLTDIIDPGIMIIDRGIVQFVRDFQLQNPTMNMAPLDLDMLRKKLFNEIKISLDFYMRQFKSEKIEELYTLSFTSSENLEEALQKELELTVKKININGLGKFSSAIDSGIVCAHGVNLKYVSKQVEFNLSGILPTTSQAAKLQEQIPEEYVPAIKVGVVCLALLSVVFFLTKMNTEKYKKQYDAIVDIQGPFVEMKPDDIQERIADNKNRLKDYQAAFQKSDVSFMMTHLAQTLPTGMWLTKMQLNYVKDNMPSQEKGSAADADREKIIHPMIIELSGYAYTSDANEQFRMVYAWINSLKSDGIIKKYSRNVVLSGIQSEQNGELVLTSFKIQVK